ncbi:MAG: hypothetical protein O8C62_07185 [Candidatus Methanoperedens sp.]|nr:hypothetical protein [Candidatus Methanoperedens sp.]
MSRLSYRKDILNCDLTKFPAVIYLALIFFISRLPFIALGFSAFTNPTDQDVLAVVNSAYLLRYDHTYTVSRFPGYPLYEFVNALFIGGGWIATNTATLVVSFVCVIIFARILNLFKIKNKALLVFTFAFIPIIWINSAITMDYMWSLMFIMLGVYLVFLGKYPMAGIAIGLAIGSRFTSAFMIIPLFFWALQKKEKIKDIMIFVYSAMGTALVVFLPVFYKYKLEILQGSGFLSTTPIRNPTSMITGQALGNIAMDLFGLAALIFLIFSVLLTFKNKPASKNKDLLNFCWLTIIIFTLLYFIFPYKVAYLIPIVPWSIVVINENLKKTFTVIICVLLLLNGIVSIKVINEEKLPAVKFDSGIVLQNYEERKSASIEQSIEYLESLSDVIKK